MIKERKTVSPRERKIRDDLKPFEPKWARGSDAVYIRFENLPVSKAKSFMKMRGVIDPEDRQNYSPTMKEMVDIAAKNKGTLEGYYIPQSTGRDDARITFDGMHVKVSRNKAGAIRGDRGSGPDEFDEKGNGYRLWWD